MISIKAMESDPNFRWCANSKCKSGQIVSNGGNLTFVFLITPFCNISVSDFAPCSFLLSAACSFFTCHRCKFKSCYTCRTPSHPNMTCAQYKAHTSPPDPRTDKYLAQNTRVCRNCRRWCQKWDGCDHITCMCGAEWCWICGVSYQEIRREGNHMHKKECTHYREYIRMAYVR